MNAAALFTQKPVTLSVKVIYVLPDATPLERALKVVEGVEYDPACFAEAHGAIIENDTTYKTVSTKAAAIALDPFWKANLARVMLPAALATVKAGTLTASPLPGEGEG